VKQWQNIMMACPGVFSFQNTREQNRRKVKCTQLVLAIMDWQGKNNANIKKKLKILSCTTTTICLTSTRGIFTHVWHLRLSAGSLWYVIQSGLGTCMFPIRKSLNYKMIKQIVLF